MAEIEGLVVTYATTYHINKTEDPVGYPWKLYANFSPPDFMNVVFAMIHGGSEEFVLRAVSRDKLIEAATANEWIRTKRKRDESATDDTTKDDAPAWESNHSRLRRLVITDPNGVEELVAGKR